MLAGPADRLSFLDAARGWALLGVYLVNLVAFSGMIFMSPEQWSALPTPGIDRLLMLFVLVFLYGKFYSIFSLLFGIGFALQLRAAEGRGDEGGLPRFRRRLLGLLAIGLVHLTFVWEGDILAFYALLAFLLIPFRHASDRTLVRVAIALLLAPVALEAVKVASGGRLDPGPPIFAMGEAILGRIGFPPKATPLDVLPTAGWHELVRFQLAGPFFRYGDLLSTGRPFKVLAMFLLGLSIGKSQWLRQIDTTLRPGPGSLRPCARRLFTWGLAVGVPANLVHAALMVVASGSPSAGVEGAYPGLRMVEALAYACGVAPLALAYVAGFALLWTRHPTPPRLLAAPSPAGRMALTNYLMQTLVSLFVFTGIGLGLMGKVGPAIWLPLGVAVFTVQVLASGWWLERFRYGPFEWIWRQWTYGRRLPLRA
jgi:uncharacterized protein